MIDYDLIYDTFVQVILMLLNQRQQEEEAEND